MRTTSESTTRQPTTSSATHEPGAAGPRAATAPVRGPRSHTSRIRPAASPQRGPRAAGAAALALGLALATSGSASPAHAAEALAATAPAAATDLAITYPREGTLFPPDIVAPTFTWKDATTDVDTWTVEVRTAGADAPARFTATEPKWRPAKDEWERIKSASVDADAEVTVTGGASAAPGAVLSTATVRIRTSKDPVGNPIFYREVPLPFLTAVQDPSRIRWRFGTIDSEEAPPIVLQNLPVCGNCHSFADNGSVLGLDVDYGNDKGAYAILPTDGDLVLNDEKIITWADFRKNDKELTFGLLSRVSPTGRYVISTVKDRSVFVATPEIAFSQLFFPIKGILVVYDRETKTFTELAGADDPQYVQTNAVWSPDGETIVFARSKAYRPEALDQKNAALIDEKDVPEFTRDKKPFRYDLFRIPFNGGKGGVAEPIPGASGDGRSNFFPKFSPDGKWIVFCKASSYMLLQPDSELYIMPAAGGPVRRLDANTPLMNSWHSWSSNSRWLVFSSKANTPYTQLFLTHIDENGMDSPPVLLERFTSPDRAANIPEFVNLPGDAIDEIREEFLDAYSFLRAGMANENTGDHAGAERSFRRGLELNPDDVELHNALGWTLFQDGRTEEAVAEYERALALDAKHVKSHNNIALALVELGRLEDAATHFRASLEVEPKAEIHSDLGFIFVRLGRRDEAVAQFEKALALDPDSASANYNLAVIRLQVGDLAGAERLYRAAVASKPNPDAHNGLGFVLMRTERVEEAIAQFRAAIEVDPDYLPSYSNLADALARSGATAEAETAWRTALAKQPTAIAHNGLGRLLMLRRDLDAAEAEFRAALALEPGNGEAQMNMGALRRLRKKEAK